MSIEDGFTPRNPDTFDELVSGLRDDALPSSSLLSVWPWTGGDSLGNQTATDDIQWRAELAS